MWPIILWFLKYAPHRLVSRHQLSGDLDGHPGVRLCRSQMCLAQCTVSCHSIKSKVDYKFRLIHRPTGCRLRETLTRTSRWCLRDWTTSGAVNNAAISATNIDLIFNMCAGASAIIISLPILLLLSCLFCGPFAGSACVALFFLLFCQSYRNTN